MTRPVLRIVGLPALGGIATGAIGAYAYYDPVLRPLAHTFGLWIILITALAAGRTRGAAVARCVVALVCAVLAFFLGRDLVYTLRYPGAPVHVGIDQLGVWSTLAIGSGIVFGVLVRHLGRDGWAAAVAAAAAAGLLLADALHRAVDRPDDAPVVTVVSVVGIAVVAGLVRASGPTTRCRAVLLLAPASCIGYLLVAIPNTLGL